jgi:hypothetical protein
MICYIKIRAVKMRNLIKSTQSAIEIRGWQGATLMAESAAEK